MEKDFDFNAIGKRTPFRTPKVFSKTRRRTSCIVLTKNAEDASVSACTPDYR